MVVALPVWDRSHCLARWAWGYCSEPLVLDSRQKVLNNPRQAAYQSESPHTAPTDTPIMKPRAIGRDFKARSLERHERSTRRLDFAFVDLLKPPLDADLDQSGGQVRQSLLIPESGPLLHGLLVNGR